MIPDAHAAWSCAGCSRSRRAKPRPGSAQRFSEAVGAARRLPCGTRARGPSRNSLRSLRSLRLGQARRVRRRSALTRAASGPAFLGASQARHGLPGHASADTKEVRGRGASAPRALEPNVEAAGRSNHRAVDGKGFFPHATMVFSRQGVSGGGDFWGGEKRRSGVGARSAPRDLSRRACLSAANCAARPRFEHRSGVGAQRRPPQHEPPPEAACRDAPDRRKRPMDRFTSSSDP